MPNRPSWFRDDQVVMSNAPTCGINKDGNEQFVVDPTTGVRSDTLIDNKLEEDVAAIRAGDFSKGSIIVRPLAKVMASRVYSPTYFDYSTVEDFQDAMKSLPGCSPASLGELQESGFLEIRKGHGSPSKDQRLGDVPYIKVSDLRAGAVNINPTNLIPIALAEKFWKGSESGLQAYDLISPERASANIGEFCVLMPGQERVVLTKEVIVLRATPAAPFDQFFLLWALSLVVVRQQWRRIVLMQTNREDVGERALEIQIPLPSSRDDADEISKPFRVYYQSLERARADLIAAMSHSQHRHHLFFE